MQLMPNYCQAILSLSSGLGHRLQKHTHSNYNPRKTPLSAHAARCEVTHTPPGALLYEISKHLIRSCKGKEACQHPTTPAPCLCRTVLQRRAAMCCRQVPGLSAPPKQQIEFTDSCLLCPNQTCSRWHKGEERGKGFVPVSCHYGEPSAAFCTLEIIPPFTNLCVRQMRLGAG